MQIQPCWTRQDFSLLHPKRTVYYLKPTGDFVIPPLHLLHQLSSLLSVLPQYIAQLEPLKIPNPRFPFFAESSIDFLAMEHRNRQQRANLSGHDDQPNRTVPPNGQGSPLQPSRARQPFVDATGEHSMLLKVIDRLRALGIDQTNGQQQRHDLPQIIVCGTQSSGKSSVLEAITTIPFPRKKNLCTRYKTRVTLERDDTEINITMVILPDRDRPRSEILDMEKFKRTLQDPNWREQMPAMIEDANKLILSGSKKDSGWTKDTLAITMATPDARPLELLDLPGLISLDEYQAGNIPFIQKMVTDEMVKPMSIILAVCKAKDDLQHHAALELAKEFKVDSWRILGVLTMPDEAGSRAETYVEMMQGRGENQFTKTFNHDWHVLRNRNDRELQDGTSTEDRDTKEQQFFRNESPWNKLNPGWCGIEALRRRLSDLLFTLAKRELPNLYAALEKRKSELDKEIEKLGGSMSDEQLLEAFEESIERLKEAARDHSRAIYEADIQMFEGSHPIHLLSRVVDQKDAFRDRVLSDGHSWELIGRHGMVPGSEAVENTRKDSRDLNAAVEYFVGLLKTMRGSELPCFYDSTTIIRKAYLNLSQDWMTFGETFVDKVHNCCQQYLIEMTPIAFSKTGKSAKTLPGFGNHEVVGKRYYSKYLIHALAERKASAIEELRTLEDDRNDTCHDCGKEFARDFMTYLNQRNMAQMVEVFRRSQEDEKTLNELDPETAAELLSLRTLGDWTQDAACELLHAMWIHYDVSD